MKKFLVLYVGSASALAEWTAMSEEKRKKQEEAGKQAWGKWAKTNEKAIVDPGYMIGKAKRVSAKGVADTKTNEIGAYAIVQAESSEAAARMFENHPHFVIFPGDAVEVMECLPLQV